MYARNRSIRFSPFFQGELSHAEHLRLLSGQAAMRVKRGKWILSFSVISLTLSGRHDSNVRPPGPKPGALPAAPRPETPNSVNRRRHLTAIWHEIVQNEMRLYIIRKILIRMTKKYSNDDITVVWKPDVCIHSTKCWKGLLEVFDPRRSPWIVMENSTTERIIDQVGQCPSGALSYYYN